MLPSSGGLHASDSLFPRNPRVALPAALPYLPGIPTLLPGEVITQEALDALMAVQTGGGVISGCTDDTLATMRVVDLG